MRRPATPGSAALRPPVVESVRGPRLHLNPVDEVGIPAVDFMGAGFDPSSLSDPVRPRLPVHVEATRAVRFVDREVGTTIVGIAPRAPKVALAAPHQKSEYE